MKEVRRRREGNSRWHIRNHRCLDCRKDISNLGGQLRCDNCVEVWIADVSGRTCLNHNECKSYITKHDWDNGDRLCDRCIKA
jgi:hypothetical protein